MAQRLLRAERKERTKSELVEAARTVFLRRGFHRASLDEIAEEAGYTKGAVYSNFDGKDDLFLAAFEQHFRRRADMYAEVIFDQESIEDSYRIVGRVWREANEAEPEWARLLTEFRRLAAEHSFTTVDARGPVADVFQALCAAIEPVVRSMAPD